VSAQQALDRDNREHSAEMGRQLAWDHEGQYIAQDVARGLYFLHNIDVRSPLVQIVITHFRSGTNQTKSADLITCAPSSSGASSSFRCT
jgi:hypothetical protein